MIVGGVGGANTLTGLGFEKEVDQINAAKNKTLSNSL